MTPYEKIHGRTFKTVPLYFTFPSTMLQKNSDCSESSKPTLHLPSRKVMSLNPVALIECSNSRTAVFPIVSSNPQTLTQVPRTFWSAWESLIFCLVSGVSLLRRIFFISPSERPFPEFYASCTKNSQSCLAIWISSRNNFLIALKFSRRFL